MILAAMPIEWAISLWIHFPVWRELKLDKKTNGWENPFSFGYTFPFEGNWNFNPLAFLRVHRSFGYTFPFEGNWNTLMYPSYLPSAAPFGYTFPFEGNWNFFQPQARISNQTLDTLSRLKGIETPCRGLEFRRVPPIFGYTFPFEGNWNSLGAFPCTTRHNFGYTFPFEGNWNTTSE